jgi:SAM-dependent methyltransferase
MAEPERWQVSTDAAEVYESCFVPAIFGAWAAPVADAAGIRSGDRVLDVGCGTGVLAREALRRVGQEGQVVGADLNQGMLAVAARTEPEITWRSGDAASLPFEDASFDVVVSQFALMYFRDRVASLREMWRTLAPGDAWRSPPGRRSIAPVVTRSWSISPSGNADVRQQKCWPRRSSSAIRSSLPSSSPTAAFRGPALPSTRVQSGFRRYKSSYASRSKARPWPKCSATMRCRLSPQSQNVRLPSSLRLQARSSCRWTRTSSP